MKYDDYILPEDDISNAELTRLALREYDLRESEDQQQEEDE